MKPVIMTKTSLALATAACLAALNPAFAATVIADADSHVWKGANGNTNYGTATTLHAQDYLATSSLLLFIRFDLSSYTPGSFTGATLDLTSLSAAAAVGKPFSVWGLKDSQNADGWGESTITYNNAPGLTIGSGVATLDVDSSKADRLDDGTLLQVASGSTVSFSDADLLSFLNADTDGLVTLIIGAPRVPGEPAFLWAAKEHATLAAPTLTFDVVPEPSAALLGGFSMLALLRRRR
jgi:hypothetical protein